MKRLLIVRNVNIKLVAKSTCLYLIENERKRVIAYRHIEAIYIAVNLETNIRTCYTIARNIPLYLIDANGYIIAELNTEINDEEV